MSFTQPTVSDFKARFNRDFPYGGTEQQVQDADITRAINEMQLIINPALFGTQASYTYGALLLSAHTMVMNLRASSQGVSGQFDWLHSSKSAGSVSEGLSIPQRILDNPELAILSKTPYGVQFLSYILPLLSGQMFAVAGRTHA